MVPTRSDRAYAAKFFTRAAYVEVRARVLLASATPAKVAHGIGLMFAAGRLARYARSILGVR